MKKEKWQYVPQLDSIFKIIFKLHELRDFKDFNKFAWFTSIKQGYGLIMSHIQQFKNIKICHPVNFSVSDFEVHIKQI